MRKIAVLKIITTTLFLHFIFYIQAETISLISPDGRLKISINVFDDKISYEVDFKDEPLLLESPLNVCFNQEPPFGKYLKINNKQKIKIDQSWEPVIGKHKIVRDHCNELVLLLKEKRFPAREFELIFRAYNDGFAFRYQFVHKNKRESTLVITDEKSTFCFPDDYTCWAVDYGSHSSHQESEYWKKKLSETNNQHVIGCPLVVSTKNAYVAITEANLNDYAGMYLKNVETTEGVMFETDLAPHKSITWNPFTTKCKLALPHYTPWRVVLVGERPGDLVESEIIMNLNEPCAIEDPSWIKPGMCAWDHWWSGDVKMDTETMKKYIKLAGDMGWPYQLIDWQWYGAFNKQDADVTSVNPALDMEEVLAYAEKLGVRCWLWLWWTDIERNMEEAFALYEKWGIAGIKIDFMARDDQEMVNWYEKTIKLAAKHHLLVNFHGAYKPTGIRRTYPNMMTREGVLGNEYSAWSLRITPEHNTTLPFTRMLCGQMDFTPGGFLNRSMEEFKNTRPTQVMGTRCHQLAMFVVYDSPVTTVCDHPENYDNQAGIDFLKNVPTVYDDMKVINGEIGEYIIMAKKKNENWFLAGMTNSVKREITVKLDFLDKGKYAAAIYKDAPDSNIHAEKLIKEEKEISSGDNITFKMAPGGGFVVHLNKK